MRRKAVVITVGIFALAIIVTIVGLLLNDHDSIISTGIDNSSINNNNSNDQRSEGLQLSSENLPRRSPNEGIGRKSLKTKTTIENGKEILNDPEDEEHLLKEIELWNKKKRILEDEAKLLEDENKRLRANFKKIKNRKSSNINPDTSYDPKKISILDEYFRLLKKANIRTNIKKLFDITRLIANLCAGNEPCIEHLCSEIQQSTGENRAKLMLATGFFAFYRFASIQKKHFEETLFPIIVRRSAIVAYAQQKGGKTRNIGMNSINERIENYFFCEAITDNATLKRLFSLFESEINEYELAETIVLSLRMTRSPEVKKFLLGIIENENLGKIRIIAADSIIGNLDKESIRTLKRIMNTDSDSELKSTILMVLVGTGSLLIKGGEVEKTWGLATTAEKKVIAALIEDGEIKIIEEEYKFLAQMIKVEDDTVVKGTLYEIVLKNHDIDFFNKLLMSGLEEKSTYVRMVAINAAWRARGSACAELLKNHLNKEENERIRHKIEDLLQ